MNYLENFPYKLKEIRKKMGLTQEELAQMLNTTKQAISYYELGKREPSLCFVIQISKILNCSIDNLIFSKPKGDMIGLNKLYIDSFKRFDREELLCMLTIKERRISKELKELREIIDFIKNKNSN